MAIIEDIDAPVTTRTTHRDFTPAALAILRMGAGLLFMQHGLQKLFGMFGGFGGTPGATAPLDSLMGVAGMLELVGGRRTARGRPVRATGGADSRCRDGRCLLPGAPATRRDADSKRWRARASVRSRVCVPGRERGGTCERGRTTPACAGQHRQTGTRPSRLTRSPNKRTSAASFSMRPRSLHSGPRGVRPSWCVQGHATADGRRDMQ